MKIRYIGSKKNTSAPYSIQEFVNSISEYAVPQIPHRSRRLASYDSLAACTMANSPPVALSAMAGNAFIKVRLRGVTRRQRWQYASDRLSFIVAPSNHARRACSTSYVVDWLLRWKTKSAAAWIKSSVSAANSAAGIRKCAFSAAPFTEF
jgi:hypothetical protein